MEKALKLGSTTAWNNMNETDDDEDVDDRISMSG